MEKLLPKPFEDRYIPEPMSGCFLWLQCLDKDGYAKFGLNGKTMKGHRYSFELTKGPIPTGLELRHTCHNKCCVNPNHLLPGTHAENMRDEVVAGKTIDRSPKGEDSVASKLTEKQVLDIFKDTRYQYVIANEYNVGKTAVWRIKHGATWSHITGLVSGHN